MSESVMYRPQTKALLVIDLQHYLTQSDSTFARLILSIDFVQLMFSC
jgi:hypothetical protein